MTDTAENATKKEDGDAEIAALIVMAEQLEPFSDVARRRMLEYLATRFVGAGHGL